MAFCEFFGPNTFSGLHDENEPKQLILFDIYLPGGDFIPPRDFVTHFGRLAIADIGCGRGASSVLLGEAYPRSTVRGFDYHGPSIDAARKEAADAGVADRVTFEVASAADYPGTGYDLVCIFDALHDMGDPTAALRHIRSTLAPDGTLMLVEPNAGDRVEDNINMVGRIYYSASTTICTLHSRAQSGADAACLGAQAGEARLRDIATAAGFSRIRRATETPFNIVLELKP